MEYKNIKTLTDLVKECSRIAKNFGGKLEQFEDPNGTLKVYKFPFEDKMAYLTFERVNSRKYTQIEQRFMSIKPNNNLKI